ncbi:hypothetical protein DLAC_05434 [Tieghemostelium lacteum]|uniref:Cysteine protease n=1 Tax=Tieghemostelium lacteum TaxID=361077 RepID=A0A151ZG09_TIELA|nr:hypothetical protein DLAC_05434 [Tieghemostelium lacteum]|eukprot:KYQ92849.1 hypothetical protein DLAC_05434 [Tieghemostelium lacteum]
MMNCLYIFRGVGSSFSQPNFSNTPIWMFGNQYKPPDVIQENNSNLNTNNGEINGNEQQQQQIQTQPQPIQTNNATTTSLNYYSLLSPTLTGGGNNNNTAEFITEFLEDFSQRVLWFTYRQGFPYIGDSIYDNDCGWGCMLRSGQMLLSNVLLQNVLGRDLWKKSSSENCPEIFNSIVRKFLDKPSSPFSIHNIALEGQKLGKQIGEWFAPTIISQAIKELVTKHNTQCNIEVFISEDSSLYIDQLEKISNNNNNDSNNNNNNNNSEKEEEDIVYDPNGFKPLLILIPLRLGLDTLNDIYFKSLLEIYKFPQNMGIVGGKPRASLYFIASQDENLFYLDPHTVQSALVNDGENFPLNSYLCNNPKKVHISEVDPSLVLSFFCKSRNDLHNFIQRAKAMNSQVENTIFQIYDNAPDYKHQKDFSISDNEDNDDNVDIDLVMDEENDSKLLLNDTTTNNNTTTTNNDNTKATLQQQNNETEESKDFDKKSTITENITTENTSVVVTEKNISSEKVDSNLNGSEEDDDDDDDEIEDYHLI